LSEPLPVLFKSGAWATSDESTNTGGHVHFRQCALKKAEGGSGGRLIGDGLGGVEILAEARGVGIEELADPLCVG
jgi:hypothetical protein